MDTVKHYSNFKKNKIIKFSGNWMELETILMSEEREIWKDKHAMACFLLYVGVFFML